MKEFSKRIFRFSSILIQTLVSAASVVLFSSFRLKKLSKINLIQSKEKCIIIANGPSLKNEITDNFDFFAENRDNIICVNFFCEDKLFTKLKPCFYLIADEAFWITTEEEGILNIQSRFISKIKLVNWKMKLLVPHDAKFFFEKNLKNDFVNLIFYNRTPVNGFKIFRHLIYKNNLGMPAPHNVLNAALSVAINLGFSKIDIYGADHSWISDLFVNEENELCCYQNHFYDMRTEVIKLEKGSLYKGLTGIILAFQSYEMIYKYAIDRNVKIINRTKKSFLDIFEFE